MSPGPVRPKKDEASAAAARALIDAVRAHAVAQMGGEPPASSVMSLALTALVSEVSDIDPLAPFSGIARSLASFAVAQGIGKHKLMAEINKAITPTYATSIARQLLAGKGAS